MASVVFTPAQIKQIATYFAQKQFAAPNATATCSLTDLQNGVSTLAMSISIGGGTVSYSPGFQPPVSNMTLAQQTALVSYIIEMAMLGTLP
jgi:hypothetical protein